MEGESIGALRSSFLSIFQNLVQCTGHFQMFVALNLLGHVAPFVNRVEATNLPLRQQHRHVKPLL